MDEYIIYILLGLLVLIVVLLIVLLINRTSNTKEVNKLQSEVQNLQNVIRNDLNILNQNNNTQFLQMNDSMHQQFYTSLQSTSKVFEEVMEKMVKIDESQNQIKDLSGDIKTLNSILNDKKTRGIFGEMELYTVLENCYGENEAFYEKQYKMSNDKVVDAIIKVKDMLIPIDSKFPLENYLRLQEEDTLQVKNQFKQDVKKHINDIYRKYVLASESCDYAYMFIPAEAIYAYIYASCSDIVQYAYDLNVYIASPTTLMAYLSVIKAFYLNEKKNERIQEMQVELQKLKLEFERFRTRYEQVSKDFDKVSKDMNDVLITASKIDKRFHQIENVEFNTID